MADQIEVKLFAGLKSRLPDGSGTVEISSDTTVGMLIEQLGIASEMARLIFVNNRRAKNETLLCDGDRVGIFPPVGGG